MKITNICPVRTITISLATLNNSERSRVFHLFYNWTPIEPVVLFFFPGLNMHASCMDRSFVVVVVQTTILIHVDVSSHIVHGCCLPHRRP